MSKSEPRRPCHMQTDFDPETFVARTACGLTLPPPERKEVVLADEWEHVTCAACKREKPS